MRQRKGDERLDRILSLGSIITTKFCNVGRAAWETWRQTWIWDQTQHSLYDRRKPHWNLIESASLRTFRMQPDKANSALPISSLKFTFFQFSLGWTRFDCWSQEFTLGVSSVGHSGILIPGKLIPWNWVKTDLFPIVIIPSLSMINNIWIWYIFVAQPKKQQSWLDFLTDMSE